MNKNYTQQSDNFQLQDFAFEPVTLSFNKRLIDHQKNQILFNKSMKKVSKLDSTNQNSQLLSELYSLLQNEDVRKNMTGGLHQRVDKIFAAAQVHQIRQNPKNQVNQAHQFKVQTKHQQIRRNLKNRQKKCEKVSSEKNLFSLKKASKQNKQNIQHRGTFNLKKQSHNNKLKKIKGIETQHSQSRQKQRKSSKKLKTFESQKCLNYISSSKKHQNKQIISTNQQKQNKNKLKNRIKQKSQQKSVGNTIQRQQSNSKYPYSLNTTVFTTRNCQVDIKNSKGKKQKCPEKRSLVNLGKSKSNSNKMKTQTQQKKKFIFKQRKHLTQQQNIQQGYQNTIYKAHTCSDQQLFEKQQNDQILKQHRGQIKDQYKHNKIYESPIKSHNILEQTCSFQFIDKIHKLQKNALNQQQQLQAKIKQLKNLIAVQKYMTQNTKCSIIKLKEQQTHLDMNNAFILNKKKQVHKKLQNLWSEVKTLNTNILQIKKQNSQIINSVDEQKQLIQMYTTVIEQLRQQLKIQIDERDEFKKKLNQSKKSQMATKIKANCTKEKTQLIIGNIRESISKWIS